MIEINNRYYSAACLSQKLNKPLYLLLAKGLIFLSPFVFMALLFFPEYISGLSILAILNFILIFGFSSVIFLAFVKHYLPQIELDSKNSEFALLDFESALIFGKALKANDLTLFLRTIVRSKGVQFFVQEVDGDFSQYYQEIIKGLDGVGLDDIFKMAKEKVSAKRKILPGDLFEATLRLSKNFKTASISLGLNEEDIGNIIFWANKIDSGNKFKVGLSEHLKISRTSFAEGWSAGYTPLLDRYGFELTKNSGGFSIEGREAIVDAIENSLTKESKSNCILVGHAGVGKSTIVRGLAHKIYWGKCLPSLAHQRIIQLDSSAIAANANSQENLEAVVRGVVAEATRAGNVILFIDEIHSLFSESNHPGTVDISEIIIPFIENSSIKIIGATSESAYQTHIAPKTNLSSLFAKVSVEPADRQNTILILEDMIAYYCEKYKLVISYEAIKEVCDLAEKYIQGKEFPAKAIDLMDEVCSSARNYSIKKIDKAVIDKLAAKITALPIAEADTNEKDKLLNLEKLIQSRVIGQEVAVKSVSDALRRARTKSDNSKRPAGSFLFLGPTGVGKTELTKALSSAYFGSEDSIIRFDMSEFQTIESIDRFIGKKIPNLEELEGGDFIKKIRSNPFSIILLDELEKAHPNILNLFLQVLDEGYLTDALGEKAIFTNAIIIATSNAGANLIRESVDDSMGYDEMKARVLEFIQDNNIYHPEFLNRFDGVILFKALDSEELLKIANLMWGNIRKNFEEKGYRIALEGGLLERLSREGYQPEFGARPMRRVFQDRIENYLAQKLLADAISTEDEFLIKIADIYGEEINAKAV